MKIKLANLAQLAYRQKSLIFAYTLTILLFIGFINFFLSNQPRPCKPFYPFPPRPPCPKQKDFDLNNLEESLKSLDQTDPLLIKYTRIKYLTPPSKLPYKAIGKANPDLFSSRVAEIFKNKRNGIFIEAGATQGVDGSHTLYLEKHLNWTGLLIECNPQMIPPLKSHHRKAWIGNVCLAPGSKPGILNFSIPLNWIYSGTFAKQWNIDKIWAHTNGTTKWSQVEVETIPLFTLIAATGWTEIDYFSFDIEGSELQVLKEFPFDRVTFKLLIIEIYFYNSKERKELDNLLLKNNYHFVANFEMDKIYVHNSVKDKLDLKRFSKKDVIKKS